MVRHGQSIHLPLPLPEQHRVRETPDRSPPNIGLTVNSKTTRLLTDLLHGAFELCQVLRTESGLPGLVVGNRLEVLRFRGGMEPNLHRSRDRALRRTSSASIGWTSPRSSSPARRFASESQASASSSSRGIIKAEQQLLRELRPLVRWQLQGGVLQRLGTHWALLYMRVPCRPCRVSRHRRMDIISARFDPTAGLPAMPSTRAVARIPKKGGAGAPPFRLQVAQGFSRRCPRRRGRWRRSPSGASCPRHPGSGCCPSRRGAGCRRRPSCGPRSTRTPSPRTPSAPP